MLNLLDDKNNPIRSNFRLTNDIKTRNKKEVEQSCAMIYKYLSKNNIDLNNFIYSGNTIITKESIEAREAMYAHGDADTIPITLCDFFTDPAWRNYVRDYVTINFFDDNSEIQCRYLYDYNQLPTSWLTEWRGELRIAFFKDQVKNMYYKDYIRVAYKEISYLTLDDIFGMVTDEDVDINAYIRKCWRDEEFCYKFKIVL